MREFLNAEPVGPAESAAVAAIEQKLRRNPQWKPSRPSGFWSFFTKPVSGLAMAAVAAMLAIGIFWQPGQKPIVIDESGDTVRSGSISGVAPLGDLPAAPDTLRWNAVPNAANYEVSLVEVDQNRIWTGSTRSAGIAIPQQARSLMRDRKTVFWVVRALGTDGRELAKSTPKQFRVVLAGRP